MHAKFIKITQIAVFSFSFVLLFAACSEEGRRTVDVSDSPVALELRRFDRDFFSMDTANLDSGLNALQLNYADFFPFYQEDIMQWPQEMVLENCRILLSDSNVLKLQDTIQQIFGDFSEEMAILDPAFKRFAHFFPEAPLPQIVLAYTEFLFRSGTDSSLLVIPLEMYLGEKYPVYVNFDIPAYMLRRMDKKHLPVVAMIAWMDQCFDGLPAGRRFIDQAIREGKNLYYLQSVLPEMADSLITGWTADQLNWLEENEFQMWTFFISENYLYSNDGAFYMPLLTDGPFTAAPNVPPGSAPRIGAYAGWQIVKGYMKQNPELSLQDLFEEIDSDKILKESGYRP